MEIIIYICISFKKFNFLSVNGHIGRFLIFIFSLGMKERILQIMQHEGLVSSKFAETIGIQRSAMSHIVSGRNNPSLDVITKILERFTYVDPDWLLIGKGSMIRATDVTSEPDLFANPADICNNGQVVLENRKDFGVDSSVSATKQPVLEKVICENTPSKIVSKIMIFYSDNTFDTFVPEKSKKE